MAMQTHDIHILVVEDDSFQRDIIVEMLSSFGLASIEEAANGHEALSLIKDASKKINFVFTDLKMPKMDGIEFLRCLGETQRNLEIVIISAMDEKLLSAVNRISSLYNLRLLGILKKPLSLKKMQGILLTSGRVKATKKPTISSNAIDFSLAEIKEGIRLKQFIPYFQPKVDLSSGIIIGAEALARWNHPKHGIIAPYAFIEKLETSKQIDSLTFFMLKEAAAIYKTFINKGRNIHIAVNLSLTSLNDPKIAQRITSTVIENGGQPKQFTLEITESTAMTGEPIALENLARLSMNGFTLSIDDYGTGYSNLQQLTRINFGELKIDRSLVHGLSDSKAMQIIVASNIDMAHKLNIKCVAEGIETKKDWDELRKMECDIGQGYLIAKPMSFFDFYSFVEQNQSRPLNAMPKVINHYIKPNTSPTFKERILVIDSDKKTRDGILKILINLGYQQAIGIDSTEAAIALFEENQFNLIFTNISMPKSNGLNFIKLIRMNKTFAKPNTRIIALDGLAQSKALGVAMALNVNDVIVKPLISNIIGDKINRIISAPCQTQNPIVYEAINTEIYR